MNNNAIATTNNNDYSIAEQVWDHEQRETIKRYLAPDIDDHQMALFAEQCRRTQLDPFTRQIYAVIRKSKNGPSTMSIQVSIDGFRLVAERTGKYAGQDGPYWCGDDGVWRDVWLDEEPPKAAKMGVRRSDWQQPLYAVARFDSYAQSFYNSRTQTEEYTKMWKTMPDVMIAKVAEALALRRAFPNDLSGLYTSDEMSQASNDRKPQPRPASQTRIIEQTEPDPTVSQLCEQIDAATSIDDLKTVRDDYLVYQWQSKTDKQAVYDYMMAKHEALIEDQATEMADDLPEVPV